jgi:NADPH:quinone reductase-like Zn-dependent oxidoreductase
VEVLAGLVADRRLRPVIDTTFSLSEAPSALKRIASGHARGKVVVAV